jgi:hypothetical protein
MRRRRHSITSEEEAARNLRERAREKSDDDILEDLLDDNPGMFSEREKKALKRGIAAIRQLKGDDV